MNPLSPRIISLLKLFKFKDRGALMLFCDQLSASDSLVALFFPAFNPDQALNIFSNLTIPFDGSEVSNLLFFLNIKESDINRLREDFCTACFNLEHDEVTQLQGLRFITTLNNELYVTRDFKVTLFDYDLRFLNDKSSLIPSEWIKVD